MMKNFKGCPYTISNNTKRKQTSDLQYKATWRNTSASKNFQDEVIDNLEIIYSAKLLIVCKRSRQTSIFSKEIS